MKILKLILTFVLFAGLGYLTFIIITQVEYGSGVVVTEERSISDFVNIEMNGVGHLLVEQTGEAILVVEAEDNVMEHISTRVRDNTLILSFPEVDIKRVPVIPTKDVIYRVTVDDLEEIKISGSGSLVTRDISVDDLSIRISGSLQGRLDMDVDTLYLVANGAGRFIAEGRAGHQDIRINGAGRYESRELVSETAKLVSNGSSIGILNASQSIDVTINGSGEVGYYGSPTITQNITGTGEVLQYKHLTVESREELENIILDGPLQ